MDENVSKLYWDDRRFNVFLMTAVTYDKASRYSRRNGSPHAHGVHDLI